MSEMEQRPESYWPAGQAMPSGAPTSEERAEAIELGKQHPAFLGGAFLDDALADEVEIARIESKSTTADVMSLRARRVDGHIAYRLVDDYDEKWLLPREVSERPLSLGELLDVLDEAQLEGEPDYVGVTLAWRQRNLHNPDDAHELVDFIRVTSRFYPDLERIDRERAQVWAAEVGGTSASSS